MTLDEALALGEQWKASGFLDESVSTEVAPTVVKLQAITIDLLTHRAEEAEQQLSTLRALVAQRTEGLADLQKHRDAWRGYAYGTHGKPQDFLDGDMAPRPHTMIEMAAQGQQELHEQNQQLQQQIIDRGTSAVAWITGDPEDAALVDVPTAWNAIDAALRLGQERSNERNDLQQQIDTLTTERNRFERTVRSIAAMLGWENVPPQDTIEREINALKARASRRHPQEPGS
jgi:hypothetical protein